jgi:sec-independent protein translocase protein TatA
MLSNFAFLDIGAPELLIILVIVLLLFGGKKLPELSRSVGESLKELKGAAKGANDLHQELKGQVNDVKATITGTGQSEAAAAVPDASEIVATSPTNKINVQVN